MGKLYKLFTPAELAKLDKRKKADLQKKLSRHIKSDPMVKAIVTAHRNMCKHLKQVLK
jgi:hypothetical protein